MRIGPGSLEPEDFPNGWIGHFLKSTNVYHVRPCSDLVEHTLDEGCACGPRPQLLKDSKGGDVWMFVHPSLDGREANEST